MPPRLKILFVCSRNQWRSPTAERVYRDDPRLAVRSAGTSSSCRHQINERDLDWADLILVMERTHASQIRDRFRGRPNLPPIKSLDIPDDYRLMNPELIALVRAGTEAFIRESQGDEPPAPLRASSVPPPAEPEAGRG